jgi:hypothetical protein
MTQSPKPSASEPNWWGLFLFLLMCAVVFYAMFGDYGAREEPQSKKTGIQAVSRT